MSTQKRNALKQCADSVKKRTEWLEKRAEQIQHQINQAQKTLDKLIGLIEVNDVQLNALREQWVELADAEDESIQQSSVSS